MMKTRPILFSTPMVQALLANQKTQTRRILKCVLEWSNVGWLMDAMNSNVHENLCPYGNVGDILYVRETFAKFSWGYEYKADQKEYPHPVKWTSSLFMPKDAARIFLKITDLRIERLQDITEEDAQAEGVERWIDTRLRSKPTRYKVYCDPDSPHDPALYSSAAYDSFQSLWYKINGQKSWDANPWVWVITFKPRFEKCKVKGINECECTDKCNFHLY